MNEYQATIAWLEGRCATVYEYLYWTAVYRQFDDLFDDLDPWYMYHSRKWRGAA